MTRADVIERALLCLAECTNDGTNYGDDTNVFPIDKFVDEGGRKVLMLAPLRVLGSGNVYTNITPTIHEDGSGFVALPPNFVRLVEFKMSAWMRSVRQPIYETDVKYAMQYHPATRGGIVKPVVAIVGGDNLEFYSTIAGDTIEKYNCITYSGIPTSGCSLPDVLLEPIAWMVASLYLASMGEIDMANVAQTKSTELIQLL